MPKKNIDFEPKPDTFLTFSDHFLTIQQQFPDKGYKNLTNRLQEAGILHPLSTLPPPFVHLYSTIVEGGEGVGNPRRMAGQSFLYVGVVPGFSFFFRRMNEK